MEPDDQETAPEHDRCRRELQRTREQLGRAQEDLARFAAQVSHDLRTPLTAILANAEMLAGEPEVAEGSDAAWMVEAVGRAARRLNHMIEQMLDFAHEGRTPVLAVTPLGRVFEQALGDLKRVVAEKHAEVTVGPLPTVEADTDQLYAVARSLLSNALKFTRQGVTPQVAVEAEQVADEWLTDGWRVSVTDNGIGVAPERQDAMFVPFARADKRIEGEGLGLATAKRVIEAHGGRIGMECLPDGGTTVWFDLPA